MTRVEFETATIADAIKKAGRIAPGKGAAFDKAAGIVLEIDPEASPEVVVRATNLELYSMEWVDAVEASGPKVSWRVPSKLFEQVICGLPIGSGKTVIIEEVLGKNGHTHLALKQGRVKATFNLMDVEYYPMWGAFDPDLCFPASDLGGRVAQVEWAAAKGDPPLSGVYFDGEKCVSTDRYRLASAPLSIPDLEEPITVPAGLLGTILKQTGEISIGVDGEQLLIMPDEHTQIRTIVFGAEYPKVDRIMHRDYDATIKVNKTAIIELMNRAASFSGADRYPTLRCFIGKGEFAVMMRNDEVGLLGDVLELPSQADHARVEFLFTPKNIIEAIQASPNEEVKISYKPDNPVWIWYLDGGSGYESWVMPRRDTPADPAA